ncbi:hypothetical protein PCE1_001708 [Barthelona sp. PCE]
MLKIIFLTFLLLLLSNAAPTALNTVSLDYFNIKLDFDADQWGYVKFTSNASAACTHYVTFTAQDAPFFNQETVTEYTVTAGTTQYLWIPSYWTSQSSFNMTGYASHATEGTTCGAEYDFITGNILTENESIQQAWKYSFVTGYTEMTAHHSIEYEFSIRSESFGSIPLVAYEYTDEGFKNPQSFTATNNTVYTKTFFASDYLIGTPKIVFFIDRTSHSTSNMDSFEVENVVVRKFTQGRFVDLAVGVKQTVSIASDEVIMFKIPQTEVPKGSYMNIRINGVAVTSLANVHLSRRGSLTYDASSGMDNVWTDGNWFNKNIYKKEVVDYAHPFSGVMYLRVETAARGTFNIQFSVINGIDEPPALKPGKTVNLDIKKDTYKHFTFEPKDLMEHEFYFIRILSADSGMDINVYIAEGENLAPRNDESDHTSIFDPTVKSLSFTTSSIDDPIININPCHFDRTKKYYFSVSDDDTNSNSGYVISFELIHVPRIDLSSGVSTVLPRMRSGTQIPFVLDPTKMNPSDFYKISYALSGNWKYYTSKERNCGASTTFYDQYHSSEFLPACGMSKSKLYGVVTLTSIAEQPTIGLYHFTNNIRKVEFGKKISLENLPDKIHRTVYFELDIPKNFDELRDKIFVTKWRRATAHSNSISVTAGDLCVGSSSYTFTTNVEHIHSFRDDLAYIRKDGKYFVKVYYPSNVDLDDDVSVEFKLKGTKKIVLDENKSLTIRANEAMNYEIHVPFKRSETYKSTYDTIHFVGHNNMNENFYYMETNKDGKQFWNGLDYRSLSLFKFSANGYTVKSFPPTSSYNDRVMKYYYFSQTGFVYNRDIEIIRKTYTPIKITDTVQHIKKPYVAGGQYHYAYLEPMTISEEQFVRVNFIAADSASSITSYWSHNGYYDNNRYAGSDTYDYMNVAADDLSVEFTKKELEELRYVRLFSDGEISISYEIVTKFADVIPIPSSGYSTLTAVYDYSTKLEFETNSTLDDGKMYLLTAKITSIVTATTVASRPTTYSLNIESAEVGRTFTVYAQDSAIAEDEKTLYYGNTILAGAKFHGEKMKFILHTDLSRKHIKIAFKLEEIIVDENVNINTQGEERSVGNKPVIFKYEIKSDIYVDYDFNITSKGATGLDLANDIVMYVDYNTLYFEDDSVHIANSDEFTFNPVADYRTQYMYIMLVPASSYGAITNESVTATVLLTLDETIQSMNERSDNTVLTIADSSKVYWIRYTMPSSLTGDNAQPFNMHIKTVNTGARFDFYAIFSENRKFDPTSNVAVILSDNDENVFDLYAIDYAQLHVQVPAEYYIKVSSFTSWVSTATVSVEPIPLVSTTALSLDTLNAVANEYTYSADRVFKYTGNFSDCTHLFIHTTETFTVSSMLTGGVTASAITTTSVDRMFKVSEFDDTDTDGLVFSRSFAASETASIYFSKVNQLEKTLTAVTTTNTHTLDITTGSLFTDFVHFTVEWPAGVIPSTLTFETNGKTYYVYQSEQYASSSNMVPPSCGIGCYTVSDGSDIEFDMSALVTGDPYIAGKMEFYLVPSWNYANKDDTVNMKATLVTVDDEVVTTTESQSSTTATAAYRYVKWEFPSSIGANGAVYIDFANVTLTCDTDKIASRLISTWTDSYSTWMRYLYYNPSLNKDTLSGSYCYYRGSVGEYESKVIKVVPISNVDELELTLDDTTPVRIVKPTLGKFDDMNQYVKASVVNYVSTNKDDGDMNVVPAQFNSGVYAVGSQIHFSSNSMEANIDPISHEDFSILIFSTEMPTTSDFSVRTELKNFTKLSGMKQFVCNSLEMADDECKTYCKSYRNKIYSNTVFTEPNGYVEPSGFRTFYIKPNTNDTACHIEVKRTNGNNFDVKGRITDMNDLHFSPAVNDWLRVSLITVNPEAEIYGAAPMHWRTICDGSNIQPKADTCKCHVDDCEVKITVPQRIGYLQELKMESDSTISFTKYHPQSGHTINIGNGDSIYEELYTNHFKSTVMPIYGTVPYGESVMWSHKPSKKIHMLETNKVHKGSLYLKKRFAFKKPKNNKQTIAEIIVKNKNPSNTFNIFYGCDAPEYGDSQVACSQSQTVTYGKVAVSRYLVQSEESTLFRLVGSGVFVDYEMEIRTITIDDFKELDYGKEHCFTPSLKSKNFKIKLPERGSSLSWVTDRNDAIYYAQSTFMRDGSLGRMDGELPYVYGSASGSQLQVGNNPNTWWLFSAYSYYHDGIGQFCIRTELKRPDYGDVRSYGQAKTVTIVPLANTGVEFFTTNERSVSATHNIFDGTSRKFIKVEIPDEAVGFFPTKVIGLKMYGTFDPDDIFAVDANGVRYDPIASVHSTNDYDSGKRHLYTNFTAGSNLFLKINSYVNEKMSIGVFLVDISDIAVDVADPTSPIKPHNRNAKINIFRLALDTEKIKMYATTKLYVGGSSYIYAYDDVGNDIDSGSSSSYTMDPKQFKYHNPSKLIVVVRYPEDNEQEAVQSQALQLTYAVTTPIQITEGTTTYTVTEDNITPLNKIRMTFDKSILLNDGDKIVIVEKNIYDSVSDSYVSCSVYSSDSWTTEISNSGPMMKGVSNFKYDSTPIFEISSCGVSDMTKLTIRAIISTAEELTSTPVTVTRDTMVKIFYINKKRATSIELTDIVLDYDETFIGSNSIALYGVPTSDMEKSWDLYNIEEYSSIDFDDFMWTKAAGEYNIPPSLSSFVLMTEGTDFQNDRLWVIVTVHSSLHSSTSFKIKAKELKPSYKIESCDRSIIDFNDGFGAELNVEAKKYKDARFSFLNNGITTFVDKKTIESYNQLICQLYVPYFKDGLIAQPESKDASSIYSNAREFVSNSELYDDYGYEEPEEAPQFQSIVDPDTSSKDEGFWTAGTIFLIIILAIIVGAVFVWWFVIRPKKGGMKTKQIMPN